jgi:hypothetical protein
MSNKTILQQFIDEYPMFYDFKTGTDNLKFASVVAYFLKDLDTQRVKIDNSKDIERPLQLYRNQTSDYEFNLMFEVHLLDIKRIILYLSPTPSPDVILFDSGEIPIGTNIYRGTEFRRTAAVISNEKYYLEVTDWHDHTFYNGFPENDIPQGDIYDKDTDIDVIGKFYGIPRRTYQAVTDSTLYSQTSPPYCVSRTYNNNTTDTLEWDYTYKERIKEIMQNKLDKSLAELEFYRLFGVYPSISNRRHSLFVMGNEIPGDPLESSKMYSEVNSPSEPNAKFLMTQEWLTFTEKWGEWNSCVYDITAVLESIKPNIKPPSSNEVELLLSRTLGISKLAICTFTEAEAAGSDTIITYDKFNMEIEMPVEVCIVSDNYDLAVSGGGDEDNLIVYDLVNTYLANKIIALSNDEVIGPVDLTSQIMYTQLGAPVYGDLTTGKLFDTWGTFYIF